ncbi:MAG: kelch repeat-containing protein, partial [Bacteroidota bacterium]
LAIVCASTNGMCEYTATNFGGAMQGDILAAAFNGTIQRFQMNAAGNGVTNQSVLASGFGSSPLDVIALNDIAPFPGTIWACTYGSDNITIFEPADFVFCTGTDTSTTVDSDGDGYSNGDELDNGTDQCNAASQPDDFDGDFLSDITDNDDDNDGILDNVDLFARDAANGTTTLMPVTYLFDNSVDPGINGWGFTGLMTDYTTDYMDLYDPLGMTVGGAALKFTVDSIPAGDALGNLNTQEYGFQFGVNTNQVFGPFTVEARVMGPFAATTPVDDMSQGLYIGSGDQDNYIKAVIHANGGAGGIEVVSEIGGVPTATMYNISGLIAANSVDLFLKVDPNAYTVQPQYRIVNGPITDVGPALAVPQAWVQGILAVGFIATSRNAPNEYPITYDYVTVTQDSVTAVGQWYNVPYNSAPPQQRHENSFVQSGDKFFLVGGRGSNKATAAFNINDSTWVNGALPPIEMHHMQAIDYKGMIWVLGAMTGGFPNETPIPNIYIYDPLSDTWHIGPALPAGRHRASSGVVVYNDEIYFISGIQNGHVSGWVTWSDKYNPQTGQWTVLADAPRARDHWQAQLVGDKIYCVGGRRSGAQGTFNATVSEVDVYDIPSNTWSTLPSPASDVPTERAGCFVGHLGDEVIIAGGESGTQSAAHEETEAVHVTSDGWRTCSPMIDSRHGTSAITNNGGLWVAAGSGNRGGGPELNTMEAFFFYGPRQPLGTAVTTGGLAVTPSLHNYGQVILGDTSTQGFIMS